MVMKADKQRLRKVLLDAISLLCKNGLPVETEFCIEATIGITLNEDDVVLVSFKEIIQPDAGILSASSRLWNDLDKTQVCEKQPDRSGPNVAISDNNIDCIYRSLDTKVQIKASNDSELVNEMSQVDYDDLTISKIPQKTGFRNRKRAFDHIKNVEVTVFNEVVDNDSQQLVQKSLLKERKSRQGTNEECVVKEEPNDSIHNDVKTEIGRLDWNKADCDDSWIYQEVYESARESYNQSPFSALSQLPNQSIRQSKGESDSRLSDGMFDMNTVSQSWNTQNRTPSNENFTNRTSNSNRQSTVTRSTSSLDQSIIVSRALQSLTRATTIDQSAASFQTGDATPAAVFCQICGARLASAATLIKHIKGTHLAMSMCQCEICGEQFKWTMQLCRHRKRYHMNEVPVPFASEESVRNFDNNHVILD